MADTPTNPPVEELVARLRAGDDPQAWDEVDGRFRPLVFGFARRIGLPDDLADEVAQETLLALLDGIRRDKFDSTRGTLRAWLLGIAKNRIRKLRRSIARRRIARGDSLLVTMPGDQEMESLWDQEERNRLVEIALAELRATTRLSDATVEAFRRTTLLDEPPAVVALSLGISAQDVYEATYRVKERLTPILSRVKGRFGA